MRALIVGVVAGALSGLFGVGGGILIVPGLVLFAGLGQRRAHATSLAAIVPIATGGVAGYALEGSVDWTAAALLAIGGAGGAVLGTRWLHRIPEQRLRRGFALFLVAAAIALVFHVSPGTGRGPIEAWTGVALIGVGLASGILAGLLGVGGGILIVPAMILLLSVPDAVAKGTSLAVIIPTALAGTIRNVRHGDVHGRAAAAVGVGGVAAAFGASLLSVRLEPRVSSWLFAGLLVVLAVWLFRRD